MISWFRREYAFVAAVVTLVIFMTNGDLLVTPFTPLRGGLVFGWLFIIILISSFSVVRHAEWLAHKFGEPYGTLILTLSVISIEVAMISSVMLSSRI